MPKKRAFSTLITTWIPLPGLIFLFCTASASAQTSPATYTFVVASGFLCDANDSGICPAVAKSANGDSYEISGAGTFDPQNKSVKAAGTFNHKSANGNVFETGVWTASEFISFDSYGIAPAAFMQRKPAFGRSQIGSKGPTMRPGPMPTGGLAVFRILLTPLSGTMKTAALQVNCALGNVPHERSVEGVRLTVEGNGGEFPEEAGGHVMFLANRPEARTTAKLSDN